MTLLPVRAIVRRHAGPVATDTLDVAAVATVQVTSEQELFPIDNVFDGQCGPGGSCWIASAPGVQAIHIRFDRPRDLDTVIVESEERGDTRTQRLDLAGWSEDGPSPFEALPLILHYSPYGPSFHRAVWDIDARAVSHLRLRVTPTPANRHASLTAIIFR